MAIVKHDIKNIQFFEKNTMLKVTKATDHINFIVLLCFLKVFFNKIGKYVQNSK